MVLLPYILIFTIYNANCQNSSENDLIITNEENTFLTLGEETTLPNLFINFSSESNNMLVTQTISTIIQQMREEMVTGEIITESVTEISEEVTEQLTSKPQQQTSTFESNTESGVETTQDLTKKTPSKPQNQKSNVETTEPVIETTKNELFTLSIETFNTNTALPPSATITINLPITTTIPTTTTTQHNLCQENEVYSCLSWCPRTCNNPLSKVICRPSQHHFCRRGCTCKNGYLFEKALGKCVRECPVMQTN